MLTYGKGLEGRLGHGQNYTMSEASKLKPAKVEQLSKMSVTKIGCGKDSTYAITDTGRLYTWGHHQYGKLGHKHIHGCVPVPKLIETLEKFNVVLCTMGRNHSFCLTDKGNVYAWGSNTFGQLGLQGVTSQIQHPQEVPELRDVRVKDIACGGFHTLLCTWDYQVYSCGKGWHGQLGQGDYESLTGLSLSLSLSLARSLCVCACVRVCLCVCVCTSLRVIVSP